MMQRQPSLLRTFFVLCGFLLFATAPAYLVAEPDHAAVSAFNSYISTVELRLAQQHSSPNGFLAPVTSTAQSETRLRQGELIIEQITPSSITYLPSAMLYHWRGTAFAPGAKAADFERLMKNFNAYPQNFSPQVLQSKILTQQGDHF